MHSLNDDESVTRRAKVYIRVNENYSILNAGNSNFRPSSLDLEREREREEDF